MVVSISFLAHGAYNIYSLAHFRTFAKLCPKQLLSVPISGKIGIPAVVLGAAPALNSGPPPSANDGDEDRALTVPSPPSPIPSPLPGHPQVSRSFSFLPYTSSPSHASPITLHSETPSKTRDHMLSCMTCFCFTGITSPEGLEVLEGRDHIPTFVPVSPTPSTMRSAGPGTTDE